jgi:hypothetical protein
MLKPGQGDVAADQRAQRRQRPGLPAGRVAEEGYARAWGGQLDVQVEQGGPGGVEDYVDVAAGGGPY